MVLDLIFLEPPAGSKWVNRKFRLTRSIDIKRVRRFGKSYAHPFLVLVVTPDGTGITRCGITAGRSVGNAVQRNRSKRLLREAMRPYLHKILPGYHILLISRHTTSQASLKDIQTALLNLLQRAGLIEGM